MSKTCDTCGCNLTDVIRYRDGKKPILLCTYCMIEIDPNSSKI